MLKKILIGAALILDLFVAVAAAAVGKDYEEDLSTIRQILEKS